MAMVILILLKIIAKSID